MDAALFFVFQHQMLNTILLKSLLEPCTNSTLRRKERFGGWRILCYHPPMAIEISFEVAQTASERLGTKYAQHLAPKGATLMAYTREEQEKLTNLFRTKMQDTWKQTNGYLLTPDQLDSLQETFNKNFRSTLDEIVGV